MTTAARSRSPHCRKLPTPAPQTLPLWPIDAELPFDVSLQREQFEWLCADRDAISDHSEEAPSLVPYLLEECSKGTPLILVFPGGGMLFRSDREGEVVCRWLNETLGLHAGLVNYRVQRRFPAAFLDARRAIQVARAHALAWNVDQNRIGVLGFSAGGHLAAMLATAWDFPSELGSEGAIVDAAHSSKAAEARPDIVILCYPAITGSGEAVGIVPRDSKRTSVGQLREGDARPERHYGTCAILLGDDKRECAWTDEQLKKVSAERWVRPDQRVPPIFLWHTAEDETVPLTHALRFSTALAAVGASQALHVFPKGRHGLALADEEDAGSASAWRNLCKAWLQEQGWVAPSISSSRTTVVY